MKYQYSGGEGLGELDLRDYVQMVWRNRWLVLSILTAVIAVSVGLTLATAPQYESTSSVLLRTPMNSQVFPTVGPSQLNRFYRNPPGEFAYVSATDFSLLAQARFGMEATVRPHHDSTTDPTTLAAQTIEFRALSSSPGPAETAAQGWAELYLEQRVSDTDEAVTSAIADIVAQIEALEAEKAEILAPLQPIEAILIDEDDPDTVARLTAQRVALQQALDDELLPIRFQLRTLNDDLGHLEIAQNLPGEAGMSARINTDATPARRVAPQPMRNLALGAVLGGLLAVGAALLNETLRVRIRGRDDVESIDPGLNILAEIPPLPTEDDPPDIERRRMVLYGAEVERAVSAVAYQAAQIDQRLRVLVTSARLGEGKSTLVEQVARRLTASHMDTIVLDGDLRRPVLHDRLGTVNRISGFAELLADDTAVARDLTAVPDHDHLRLLPAGKPTGEAAPLLRRSFERVFRSFNNDAGVLLVDSPPVLAVTDAEIMANHVDRIIVVVRAGVTTRAELRETLDRLSKTPASILGVVLIGVDPSRSSRGYGYGYGYGYGATEDPTPPPAPPQPPTPPTSPRGPAGGPHGSGPSRGPGPGSGPSGGGGPRTPGLPPTPVAPGVGTIDRRIAARAELPALSESIAAALARLDQEDALAIPEPPKTRSDVARSDLASRSLKVAASGAAGTTRPIADSKAETASDLFPIWLSDDASDQTDDGAFARAAAATARSLKGSGPSNGTTPSNDITPSNGTTPSNRHTPANGASARPKAPAASRRQGDAAKPDVRQAPPSRVLSTDDARNLAPLRNRRRVVSRPRPRTHHDRPTIDLRTPTPSD
ncbi:MAG: polysaccharide biosynthesis tyrosine autokinase [Actinomycetota bacterium]